jgi:hypothetical protein
MRRRGSSSQSDVDTDDRLLRLIGDTEGLMELDEFGHELLHAVHRAVPAD